MVVCLTIFCLILAGSLAEAQIYEWRDATGARNFTNDIEDVPVDQRDAARIVVRASPPTAAQPEVTGDPREVTVAEGAGSPTRKRREEPEEPEEPRLAQVIYDHSFRFARTKPIYEPAPEQIPAVNVNIAGPLAVSNVIVPQTAAPPIGSYEYYGYGRIPLGLRPHRGDSRSRHQPNSSSTSVLSPAPIGPGSPAFMPMMRDLSPRPVARR